jgi:phosphonopyruvate decarboxylase
VGDRPVIAAHDFLTALKAAGYSFFSGVPCSYLQGPFAMLEREPGYTAAPHEGVALSVAAGSEMSGRASVVLLQNSGLGNLVDPLTSLLLAYEIPALLVISLRGRPTPADDEPHHAAMGRATVGVLDSIGIGHVVLEPTLDSLRAGLAAAADARGRSEPFALLVPGNTIAGVESTTTVSSSGLSRRAAVLALVTLLNKALVVTTTGMISREVFGLADRAQNFYMQGSMGHAIGIGIGVALAHPQTPVVVVDGDGAMLMHLGASALVGHLGVPNLIHVVLDNGGYGSTGGQVAAVRNTRWADLARSLGYATATACHTAAEVEGAAADALMRPGPHLVSVLVADGGGTPPRVTTAFSNPQICSRFVAALQGERL